MANVQGKFYTSETQRRGVTPSSPPNADDDPQDPISPSIPVSFITLTDTPSSYSGQTLKGVRVNAAETGLEFYTITSGGITDAPNDGLAYARKSLAWAQLSPYDLSQVGATNGQVLTWSTVNSRYEPSTVSGASNWTVVGSDIYRNSNVAIGRTTIPVNDRLTLRQSADNDTVSSIRCENNSAVLKFEVRNTYSLFQTEVAISGQTTGSNALRVRQRTNDDTVDSLRCENLAGTAKFQVKNTFALFSQDLAIVGGGSLNALLVRAATGVIFRGQNSSSVEQCTISNTGIFSGGVIITGTRNLSIGDANNVILATTTGTKFGTATTQKLAFWNKTPIIQPTTGITASAFVANTSGIANDTATYGGYTMGQIAAALINTGILA